MKHFVKKNFSFLGGAGGGPKTPDPPAPPTLKPAVLGDLQAISSYDYVESIDLISDGVIDGLVNQRGEYVNDIGIFEGIYLEDFPIKQSYENSTESVTKASLSFIAAKFSQTFYNNKTFLDKTLTSVLDQLKGSSSLGTETKRAGSFSVLNSRKDIANSIYSSIENINYVLKNNSISQSSTVYKRLSNLAYKFNYTSSREVLSYLLPNFPQEFDEDYPFFCLKIDLDLPTTVSLSLDTLVYVENDFVNQTYLPLESTELQNKRFILPPSNINLTYFNNLGATEPFVIRGSFYLFLYKNDDKPFQNSIDAVINQLKSINITNDASKYNFSNASMEIRNGDELQKPLSSFNKAYSDKQYSTKLRGPYGKLGPIKTLTNSATPLLLNSQFDVNSPSAKSGVDISILSSTIDKSEYDAILAYNVGLTNPLFPGKNAEKSKKLLESELSSAIGNLLHFKFINIYQADGVGDLIGFKFSYSNTWNAEEDPNDIDEDWKTDNKILNVIFNRVSKNFKIKFTTDGPASLPDSYTFLKDTDPVSGERQIVTDINSCMRVFRGPSRINIQLSEITALLKTCVNLLYRDEGSSDVRPTVGGVVSVNNFSSWNKEYVNLASEPAIPITHIVNNPNVDRVYVTLSVQVLSDMAAHKTTLRQANVAVATFKKVDAGTLLPTVVNFKIELGYQDKNGVESITAANEYQIKGTANSPASIDIGREENNNSSIIPKYTRFIMGAQQNFAAPLILPSAQPDQLRFVRVYRSTYESYSTLVKREILLEKVTEVVNLPFSYPYSTICGLKLDARTLPQIPARSYDARFKKVFVPSNYFPLKANGKDKRYLTASEKAVLYTLPDTDDSKVIYRGNWDGTFKLAWTDNPAWIIFDLLINRRYGLGNFISPTQVNYWELYKIAQFCDAVIVGVFVGVPAADGGLEPRYGFNGVIADKTNVFDMIKSIVASFRGNMFYTDSEINFTNDRLKPIISSFNNSNVKDGSFSYTNSRKDLQYNVIEVSYLDRDDLFKEKIEYVEDADDIKTRGILRTSAQTFGVTSRAHAKRIGEHTIYSTINEDQNVQFVGGLETLLCRPGDLISINDELRTLKKHVGRVLEIDLANSIIHTNIDLTMGDFSSTGLFPQLSVLIPTGKNQFEDFYNLAKSPSKLSISELYQTDIPQNVVFNATGTGFDSFGTKFYLETSVSNSGLPLLENAKIGVPCSVTLANTAQEVYKIQSIKELNLNEYEIVASKFDTGKFAEIEAGETLNDFYSSFPSTRQIQVNEGAAYSVSNQAKYDLTGVPLITSFTTGNFDAQNDVIDINGTWQSVNNANSYNVELITPKYRSIKKQTSLNSVTFEDQSEVGTFTLRVSAVQTGVYPVLISATHSATLKVLSYTAPVRSNGILINMGLGPTTITV